MIPITHSQSLQDLLSHLRKGENLFLEGLSDATKAFLVSFLQEELKKQVIIISGGTSDDNWMINLGFFSKKGPIELPAWEVLPGEAITPNADLMGERLKTLSLLSKNGKERPLLSSFLSLMQKVLPKSDYSTFEQKWKKGAEVLFNTIPSFLSSLGFEQVSVVSDKGEFAIRGGIVDLFPISSTIPYRVEFFGDTIEEIRTFDPMGQKSIEKIKEISFGPANEKRLSEGREDLTSPFDLLDDSPLILFDDLLAIEDQMVSVKSMPGINSPLVTPLSELLQKISGMNLIFCSKHSIESLFPFTKKEQVGRHQKISFEWLERDFHSLRFFHSFMQPEKFFDSEEPILELMSRPSHKMELLCISKEKNHAALQEKLSSLNIKEYTLLKGEISEGFTLADIPSFVLSDQELFGTKAVRKQQWRQSSQAPIASFHALSPGDFVVHLHSGIGKYLGTEKQTDHRGITSEYLLIEYAEKSKLYVPLTQSHLVSKYIGSHETKALTLSTLGSKKWQQAKRKAQNEIVGYAADLLQLYAKREVEKGTRFPPDSAEMLAFEEAFPFDETPDQQKAIEEVKEDMITPKPMDRLICGDVGYGKTEVAMRAAFKAVFDGKKQVALLVPTTVLAMQHFDSFSERMAAYPLVIKVISRAQTSKENRETLKEVEEGKVDILIGTHRILSKDVLFKDLGLIIIDEEQRFGVRAKEKLKSLKHQVDYLTMSATPIPRTLYLSLMQLRNISVITTPPQNRLPIKTIIAENNDEVIKNALLREQARGGQSFFIHNRVESIAERASYVQKLVPSARIAIVHGQMEADAIDLIFHRFKKGEVDILFATTLVENGIDVPNANTILIDKANHFGLADLYQLRGRVGRWNRPSYAYFLVPKRTSDIARKRLSALLEASGHGGGMKIALRDLEIRGAGDILGVRQSGQVSSVGFHLYCKMLKKAIEALKEEMPARFVETKMEFSFPASIPESYIPESSLRMELYHRIGESASYKELDVLQAEIVDRFGKLPKEVIWLYHMSRLRIFASANEFSQLLFKEKALIAEKKKEKKVIPFHKSFDDPKQLEEFVIAALSAQFRIVWRVSKWNQT